MQEIDSHSPADFQCQHHAALPPFARLLQSRTRISASCSFLFRLRPSSIVCLQRILTPNRRNAILNVKYSQSQIAGNVPRGGGLMGRAKLTEAFQGEGGADTLEALNTRGNEMLTLQVKGGTLTFLTNSDESDDEA